MAMCWSAKARESGKYKRALPPAHYSLKIESFEVLSMLDEYDCGVFETGNYKWRLSIYPKGNEGDNGKGYISLYLSIDDLPSNKTVHVNYKLFVYDKLHNKYLTMQDADEKISSFHHLKKQHGFPRFLSLKEFKKPSNGYLDENDSCTFGAEVFVIQHAEASKHSFTLTKYPTQYTFRLEIKKWSKLGMDLRSKEFDFEGRQWKLLAFTKDDATVKGKSLSVYLEAQSLIGKMKVYAEFNLRLLDQVKKKNKEKQFKCWLSASHPRGGDAEFMPLKDIEKKSATGFVQDDTLLVEVQISVVSKHADPKTNELAAQ